ncbi:sensor histidine kinase [Glycomyces arizonensis]|uniref:sensor histidine kinase n=1 Tax=Glycomyces arizonensis TaxID=256035 RepID=UPI00146FA1C4|nr:histidine kinase [Glycomyces arizonensis]
MTGSPKASATALPTLLRRLDALLSRFGIRGTFPRDAVLALVVAVLTFGMFATLTRLAPTDPTIDLSAAEGWTITAFGVVQSLLLCLRRLRPVLCVAAVMACQMAMTAVAPGISGNGIGPAVAVYTIGSIASLRFTIAVAATAVLAPTAAAAAASLGEDAMFAVVTNHLTSNAVVLTAAALIGMYVAARRRNAALDRERATAVLRAHRERAEAAVIAERARIARELHDVAAHHLSGMVIQAAAVERLIGRDAEAAKSGAAWIRSQGKATLENLRQVVGLLRDTDTDGNAPVPGVSALPALMAEARQLGSEVESECSGEPLRLPPIADISLYRIAQQALTNARQHAPGASVRIRLAYGDKDVVLEVTNGHSSRGELADVGRGGTGLVGMRERADLVGADFTAGPTGDGGWRVRVALPVRDTERRAEDIEFETGDRT